MSSITWTLPEVASEREHVELTPWRAVEAQHFVSTLALVDSLEEQHELERLLDASKPPMPESLHGLHWLLFTPFRYPPPPGGSRFRSPAQPGVLYGADDIRTACAELGYWRWRFLADSPDLTAITARPQTVFRLSVSADAVDLRLEPFVRDRAAWTHPHDYAACHAFAETARAAELGAIRYESVRDPERGGCVAVLSPGAFARREPIDAQTWLLSVTRSKVYWHRHSALDASQYEFSFAEPAPDRTLEAARRSVSSTSRRRARSP